MVETTEVAIVNQELTPAQFKKNHENLAKFVKTQLREAKNMAAGDGGDYGIIPYTRKMSLLKPGAEKLLKLFGLVATFELVKEIEDWDKKFIYYRYKCTITHAPTGKFIADAIRSCNNKEKKHATKDVYEVANTVESIAQKRALVAATVQATMASEIFDADVSDNDDTAPTEKVTKQEDPRRIGIFSKLYAAAGQRGIDNILLHRLAKKKFEQESLTELSNNQLEELIEVLIEYYFVVPKGDKPLQKTKTAETQIAIETKPPEEIFEGEVVEQGAFDNESQDCVYTECKKGIDGKRAKRTGDGLFCSEGCKEDYTNA